MKFSTTQTILFSLLLPTISIVAAEDCYEGALYCGSTAIGRKGYTKDAVEKYARYGGYGNGDVNKYLMLCGARDGYKVLKWVTYCENGCVANHPHDFCNILPKKKAA